MIQVDFKGWEKEGGPYVVHSVYVSQRRSPVPPYLKGGVLGRETIIVSGVPFLYVHLLVEEGSEVVGLSVEGVTSPGKR